MAGFYIKKVIAEKQPPRADASVSFGKGLTIIQGRSDSGKTCVANCIDFIFVAPWTSRLRKRQNMTA